MRGDVYRLGRRRTGSVLLALAAAGALAGAPATTAASAAAKPVPHHPVKPPSPVAHAAGHKIA